MAEEPHIIKPQVNNLAKPIHPLRPSTDGYIMKDSILPEKEKNLPTEFKLNIGAKPFIPKSKRDNNDNTVMNGVNNYNNNNPYQNFFPSQNPMNYPYPYPQQPQPQQPMYMGQNYPYPRMYKKNFYQNNNYNVPKLIL